MFLFIIYLNNANWHFTKFSIRECLLNRQSGRFVKHAWYLYYPSLVPFCDIIMLHSIVYMQDLITYIILVAKYLYVQRFYMLHTSFVYSIISCVHVAIIYVLMLLSNVTFYIAQCFFYILSMCLVNSIIIIICYFTFLFVFENYIKL